MRDQDIKDIFDSNLSITLKQLSRISGKTVEQVKKILLEGESYA